MGNAKKKAKVRVMPRIPAKYFEAVANGIAFLDLVLGRKVWLRRMNMRKFKIEQSNACIAGNVFKDALFDNADDGYNSFLEAVNTLGDDKASERLGFSANSEKGWQYLQDIWVRRINYMKRSVPKGKK